MKLPIETKGRPLTDYVGETGAALGSTPEEFSGTLEGDAKTPRARHGRPDGAGVSSLGDSSDPLGYDDDDDLGQEDNPAAGRGFAGPIYGPIEGGTGGREAEAETVPFIQS